MKTNYYVVQIGDKSYDAAHCLSEDINAARVFSNYQDAEYVARLYQDTKVVAVERQTTEIVENRQGWLIQNLITTNYFAGEYTRVWWTKKDGARVYETLRQVENEILNRGLKDVRIVPA